MDDYKNDSRKRGSVNRVRKKPRGMKPKPINIWETMSEKDISSDRNQSFLRTKNAILRFSALLTGTTIFHTFKKDDLLGWKKTSFSAVLDQKRKAEKITKQQLSQKYVGSKTLLGLKKTLSVSGFSLVKEFFGFSNRPGQNKRPNQRKRPTQKKVLTRERLDGKKEIVPISETNAKTSKQVYLTKNNTKQKEYVELRREIKKNWRRSFSDIENDFRNSTPVITQWDDVNIDVGSMSPRGANIVDTNLRTSFTIRNNRMFVGEKFGTITSTDREENIKNLFSQGLKEGIMKDKNGKLLSEDLPIDKKYEAVTKKFMFDNNMTIGSNILKRNKFLCATDELSNVLKLSTFEKSISTAQKERLKKMEYDLEFNTVSNTEKKELMKEISLTKNMIQNPSYSNYCKIVNKRQVIKKNNENSTRRELLKNNDAFYKAMFHAPIDESSVTIYEDSNGKQKVMVMVPYGEVNGFKFDGMSPSGDTEVELSHIKSIKDLPDGKYVKESDVSGYGEVLIENGEEMPMEDIHEHEVKTPEVSAPAIENDNTPSNTPSPQFG